MVAKENRKLLDEVADRVRGLINDLERLLIPEPKRKPARVPVPVRTRPERYPKR